MKPISNPYGSHLKAIVTSKYVFFTLFYVIKGVTICLGDIDIFLYLSIIVLHHKIWHATIMHFSVRSYQCVACMAAVRFVGSKSATSWSLSNRIHWANQPAWMFRCKTALFTKPSLSRKGIPKTNKNYPFLMSGDVWMCTISHLDKELKTVGAND